MSSERPKPLTENELQLLRQYRESISPTRDRQQAAWTALAPLAKAGALTSSALVMISVVAVAVIGGGIAVWKADPSSSRAVPEQPASTPETHEPRPPVGGPVPAPAPEPVRSVPTVVAQPRETPHGSWRQAATSGSPETAVVGLDAEVRSLEAIRAAFVSGPGERVVSLIAQHRAAFAKPVFGEEIDAIEVLSLCGGHALPQGRARLERFAKRYPRSPQLPALRRACEHPVPPLQRPKRIGVKK